MYMYESDRRLFHVCTQQDKIMNEGGVIFSSSQI